MPGSLRLVEHGQDPTVLRSSTGGEKEIELDGGTVGDVLRALTAKHPATESQLFSEQGELNRYVNVYLNDEDVRVLDGPRDRGGRLRHRDDPARHGGWLSSATAFQRRRGDLARGPLTTRSVPAVAAFLPADFEGLEARPRSTERIRAMMERGRGSPALRRRGSRGDRRLRRSPTATPSLTG